MKIEQHWLEHIKGKSQSAFTERVQPRRFIGAKLNSCLHIARTRGEDTSLKTFRAPAMKVFAMRAQTVTHAFDDYILIPRQKAFMYAKHREKLNKIHFCAKDCSLSRQSLHYRNDFLHQHKLWVGKKALPIQLSKKLLAHKNHKFYFCSVVKCLGGD
jgi:hypothetical protein